MKKSEKFIITLAYFPLQSQDICINDILCLDGLDDMTGASHPVGLFFIQFDIFLSRSTIVENSVMKYK